MRSGQPVSRRNLLTTILGLCVWPRLAAALPRPDDPFPGMLKGFSRTTAAQRHYRVDATVLFCGIPVLTKRNVGGGHASVEAGSKGESHAVALQFAAGSWPERAGGLNRLGILREVVVERPDEPLGFAFAGLITNSPEQNFEEAKKTFLHGAPKALEAIVASGDTRNGVLYSSTEVVHLPAQFRWTSAANELLTGRPSGRPDSSDSHAQLLPPFLYAMRCAGLDASPRYQRKFLHKGKPYSL